MRRLVESEADNSVKTTRRAALLNLAGAATVSTFPIFGQNPPPESHHSMQPVTKEAATPYHFVFFRPEQMETLEALTETIIPADDHSPGAKAARVAEYIDVIVADASPSTQAVWNAGLKSVDDAAQGQFATSFGRCTSEQRIALLSKWAINEGRPVTADEKFFAVVKRATIDGYYTSRIGIHDELEYQGNTALGSYPGCTRPVV